MLSSPDNNAIIAFPLPLDVRGIVPQGPMLGAGMPAAPAQTPNGGAGPATPEGVDPLPESVSG